MILLVSEWSCLVFELTIPTFYFLSNAAGNQQVVNLAFNFRQRIPSLRLEESIETVLTFARSAAALQYRRCGGFVFRFCCFVNIHRVSYQGY
jgi:hypothetical protein